MASSKTDKPIDPEFEQFWKSVPRLTDSTRKEWTLAGKKAYPDRPEGLATDSAVFEAKIRAVEERYGKIPTPVWNAIWSSDGEFEWGDKTYRLMGDKDEKRLLWDVISSRMLKERVDVYKMFPLKKKANDEDPKYAFRSIVVFRMGGQQFAVMFPPTTLQTTENRYEFLRHLDAYVKDLEKNGAEILAVHGKDSPEYQKYTGKAKPGYEWKQAR